MVRWRRSTISRGLARSRPSGRRPRPGWWIRLGRKAKEFAYPHELWTVRPLARDAREHGSAVEHDCLASPAQGTVCEILNKQELKPHRVRYYLERRDPVVHTWFHRLEDVGCYEPNFGNGGLVAPRPFAEQTL